MTYQEALDFLYSALPMYQRMGKTAFKKDLSNTLALCEALGNPHKQFKSVHIAGTNGKGSSSHMMASILQEAGYKVGLYTSPHLKSFTERIRINGIEISERAVISFVKNNKAAIEEIQPSFFEMTVAMAFDFFSKNAVDIAVIEVGLGGRLDSTNIITPEACLITNIGYDHMDMLGDTLAQIASEKAGIIKSGVPVVVSESHSETLPVFTEKAKAYHARLLIADQLLPYPFETSLIGPHQRKNLQGVVTLTHMLREQGWEINIDQIKAGLMHVSDNTGLKGRWQVLNKQPLTVCDTGHNKEALVYIVEEISNQNYENLYMVLGFAQGKEVSEILHQMPEANYIFTRPNVPRGLPIEELQTICKALNIQGEFIEDVNEAIALAKSKAKSSDMIYIGGSTFVVAEIEEL